MRDEGVDVALRVGNVSERPLDNAGAVTIGDVVFVDRSTHCPTDLSALVLGRLFRRLLGQGDEALLQMLETCVTKRRTQSRDKSVELSVVIANQSLKYSIGQCFRIAFGGFGQPPKLAHAAAEDFDHRSAAVITTREYRGGERHETPHEIERFFRIGLSDMFDNRASLRLEVLDESAAVLPIDEASRASNGGETLADFARCVGRALRPREGKAQASFCGGVAAADVDQQFGQPRCAERFQVLGVERVFRRHIGS